MLKPPQLSPPLCGQICGEFPISQVLGCLHTSQPQASQEVLPVRGREGPAELLHHFASSSPHPFPPGD